jgi:hypothetical protein
LAVGVDHGFFSTLSGSDVQMAQETGPGARLSTTSSRRGGGGNEDSLFACAEGFSPTAICFALCESSVTKSLAPSPVQDAHPNAKPPGSHRLRPAIAGLPEGDRRLYSAKRDVPIQRRHVCRTMDGANDVGDPGDQWCQSPAVPDCAHIAGAPGHSGDRQGRLPHKVPDEGEVMVDARIRSRK